MTITEINYHGKVCAVYDTEKGILEFDKGLSWPELRIVLCMAYYGIIDPKDPNPEAMLHFAAHACVGKDFERDRDNHKVDKLAEMYGVPVDIIEYRMEK